MGSPSSQFRASWWLPRDFLLPQHTRPQSRVVAQVPMVGTLIVDASLTCSLNQQSFRPAVLLTNVFTGTYLTRTSVAAFFDWMSTHAVWIYTHRVFALRRITPSSRSCTCLYPMVLRWNLAFDQPRSRGDLHKLTSPASLPRSPATSLFLGQFPILGPDGAFRLRFWCRLHLRFHPCLSPRTLLPISLRSSMWISPGNFHGKLTWKFDGRLTWKFDGKLTCKSWW